MISTEQAKRIVNELFEEEALVLGGLVAMHRLDDDLVWRLIKNLDVIRGRFLRRIDSREMSPNDSGCASRLNLKPHPAIEDFLLTIRRACR